MNDTEVQLCEGWPQLATLVRQERSQRGFDLLLHAGDICLGHPDGPARIQILNVLGFDAIALGNHDLDLGADALGLELRNCTASVLCANVTGYSAVKPYITRLVNGERIAICGITRPDMHLLQPERNIPNMQFHDPIEVLSRLVPQLRREATRVVVLSHCGLEADQALAQQVDGIDLIVGGHSHHALATPLKVGGASIVQAGSGASHLGWVCLDQREDRLVVSGGLLSTAGVSPDPEILAIERHAELAQADHELVGYIDADLRSSDSARETPLGNWTADTLRAYAAADIALVRCSAVPTTLCAGPVVRSQVSTLNSVGLDRVARLSLSGSELRAVLECGARDAYYLLTTSGARVVYDAAKPIGQRVRSVTVRGEEVHPDLTYTVACSEIFARGAAGFTPLVGKAYELLPDAISEVLARQLAAEHRVFPRLDGRLVVHGNLPRRT